jgi:hypothetical protein
VDGLTLMKTTTGRLPASWTTTIGCVLWLATLPGFAQMLSGPFSHHTDVGGGGGAALPLFDAHVSVSTVASNTIPTPTPDHLRECCSDHPSNFHPTRNPSGNNWTSLDNWIAAANTIGAPMIYTPHRFPTYMTGATTNDPPSDLYGTGTAGAPVAAACQFSLSGTNTTNCMWKELWTDFFRHICRPTGSGTDLSAAPGTPLVGVCRINIFEVLNEFNSDNYFINGTYGDLAKMANDFTQIENVYCGDCGTALGSVTAGGDGFHTNGESGRYDTAAFNMATAWKAITPNYPPTYLSYHAYPARTNIQPAPMPETIISDNDPSCLTASKTVFCRDSIIDEPVVLRAILAPLGAPWSTLPMIQSEGGFGTNNAMADSINLSAITGTTTATATATKPLPAAWTTGTWIYVSGASNSAFNSGAVQITKTGASTFTYPDAGSGTAATSGLATTVLDATGATSLRTWTKRQAYVGRWFLAQAQSEAILSLWYVWQDPCWGTQLGTNSLERTPDEIDEKAAACSSDPILPNGTTPVNAAFAKMKVWLASSSKPTAYVKTVSGSGFIYTTTFQRSGVNQVVAFFDVQDSTATFTMPGGMTHVEDMDGTITTPGATVTLDNRPKRIYP